MSAQIEAMNRMRLNVSPCPADHLVSIEVLRREAGENYLLEWVDLTPAQAITFAIALLTQAQHIEPTTLSPDHMQPIYHELRSLRAVLNAQMLADAVYGLSTPERNDGST